MKRHVVMATLLLSLAACGEAGNEQTKQAASAPALRRDAARVCKRDLVLLVLELLPRERGYRLNTELLDSANLATFLQVQLPEYPPERRNVYVRLDSGRAAELRWLVPVIERAGGRAYEPDSTCSRTIVHPSH
jgi:hypothetical protein